MFTKIILIFGLIFIPLIDTPSVQPSSIHSIKGTILLNSAGLSGVTVTIQGTTFTATTNGSGNYYIPSIPNGTSGTIVPSLAGYSFSPTSISFSNILADLTGQNFTATQISPIFYGISGAVTLNGIGLAGVLITFGTFTATTLADGTYSMANIPSATKGRIVPSLTGYMFTPSDITVANLSGNLVNQNFTASPVFTISGKVTDGATLLPLGGVTVSFGTFSAVSSAATGAYTIRNVPAGTSGVLTPTLSPYVFIPATITVSNLQTDIHSQNFEASP